MQAVSFLSERRVLVGRAVITGTDTNAGQQVPFYLMPTLGGDDTLRAFPIWFYGPRLLIDMLPWSLVLPLGLWHAWRHDTEARSEPGLAGQPAPGPIGLQEGR